MRAFLLPAMGGSEEKNSTRLMLSVPESWLTSRTSLDAHGTAEAGHEDTKRPYRPKKATDLLDKASVISRRKPVTAGIARAFPPGWDMGGGVFCFLLLGPARHLLPLFAFRTLFCPRCRPKIAAIIEKRKDLQPRSFMNSV